MTSDQEVALYRYTCGVLREQLQDLCAAVSDLQARLEQHPQPVVRVVPLDATIELQVLVHLANEARGVLAQDLAALEVERQLALERELHCLGDMFADGLHALLTQQPRHRHAQQYTPEELLAGVQTFGRLVRESHAPPSGETP
jgi:hypothetical protein